LRDALQRLHLLFGIFAHLLQGWNDIRQTFHARVRDQGNFVPAVDVVPLPTSIR
jgi:hypothetical protein